jgi:ribonucleoside-diphosphate reductase beta chain
VKVFDSNNRKDNLTKLAFLDQEGGVTIQRYDVVKYRQFEKLTEKQLGFFWRPEEVDVMKDSNDYRGLSPHEKHIFISNLKRQIVLDSVQGRSPNLAFLPLVSLPELETWIETWAQNETVHSRSYTHIIRNIVSNPSEVFDTILDIPEIVNCAASITKYYDDLIEAGMWYNLLGVGTHTVNGATVVVDLYQLKKKIWIALNSVNALEGIRFYVSFACSWAFAELKRMEGNAKIIKQIARDENVHLGSTQTLLKLLPTDDADFASIREETREQCEQIFLEAAQQEKDWAKYLFKDGSIIGLNTQLLCDYVDWLTCKRMVAVGLHRGPKLTSNPLPWTQKWIAGAEVQVAPQETEISSYIIGGTKQDVDSQTFSGFSL